MSTDDVSTDGAPLATDPPAATPSGGPPPRSAAFRRFMVAPLVVAGGLVAATLALVVLAIRGGQAEGDRVDIQFDTCAAAAPRLAARAHAIGLGDPQAGASGGRVTLSVTLPGLDDDRVAIPALLAAPGLFEITSEGAVLATHEDITLAQVQLDESGLPYTWIELDAEPLAAVTAAVDADPHGQLIMRLDGVVVAERPNTRDVADGGLRIVDGGELVSRDRMRRSVDRAILLSEGPLPCPTRVESVTSMATGEADG